MDEYISREALLKRLDMASDCKNCPRCVDMKTYYDRCAYTDIQDVCSVISDMPAADVQPIDRWISVNDKLPEQDEKVLVLTKDKDIMTMIYKVIPFRWYKPKFGGFDKDYVTHWKPLKDGDTNG